jgi:hypothetical protein
VEGQPLDRAGTAVRLDQRLLIAAVEEQVDLLEAPVELDRKAPRSASYATPVSSCTIVGARLSKQLGDRGEVVVLRQVRGSLEDDPLRR